MLDVSRLRCECGEAVVVEPTTLVNGNAAVWVKCQTKALGHTNMFFIPELYTDDEVAESWAACRGKVIPRGILAGHPKVEHIHDDPPREMTPELHVAMDNALSRRGVYTRRIAVAHGPVTQGGLFFWPLPAGKGKPSVSVHVPQQQQPEEPAQAKGTMAVRLNDVIIPVGVPRIETRCPSCGRVPPHGALFGGVGGFTCMGCGDWRTRYLSALKRLLRSHVERGPSAVAQVQGRGIEAMTRVDRADLDEVM